MADTKLTYPLALFASFGLTGCGFWVPEMNVFSPDRDDGSNEYSIQGDFEQHRDRQVAF